MREIYLDNAATTQVSQPVIEKVTEVMGKQYGNPSSLHKKGIEAELVVKKARKQIADGLGCLPEELVFTSGGTEANNLAILGGVATKKRQGKTIVTTLVEHSSVLEPFAYLKQQGYTVVRVAPLKDGSLDIDALVEAVTEDTVLVSAMLVNSELGCISEIATAVKQVKRKNSNLLFHTDAVQGFGKTPFTIRQLGVDLLSISGHKLHAPKGVGALYVKKGVRLLPTTYGGGQEQGLRSGTEAVPLIAGFGVATERAMEEKTARRKHMEELNHHFMNKLQNLQGVCSNSSQNSTLYIQNLSILGYRSEILLHYLADHGIYVSSGSACSKGATSHVLTAIGLPKGRTDSALRISFSYNNKTDEIDKLFLQIEQAKKDILRGN